MEIQKKFTLEKLNPNLECISFTECGKRDERGGKKIAKKAEIILTGLSKANSGENLRLIDFSGSGFVNKIGGRLERSCSMSSKTGTLKRGWRSLTINKLLVGE